MWGDCWILWPAWGGSRAAPRPVLPFLRAEAAPQIFPAKPWWRPLSRMQFLGARPWGDQGTREEPAAGRWVSGGCLGSVGSAGDLWSRNGELWPGRGGFQLLLRVGSNQFL